MTDDPLEPAVWHRLHPLSPIVRAGRATIGIAIVLIPSVLTGRLSSRSFYELGVVGVLLVLGFVSWLVTRWRVEDDDLRIETGLIRRQSLRFPLAQVQAIDIVRPGLARMVRSRSCGCAWAAAPARPLASPICTSARPSLCARGCSRSLTVQSSRRPRRATPSAPRRRTRNAC